MDNTNKIINFIGACNELDIKINAPNINSSKLILSQVIINLLIMACVQSKGVGENAAKHILKLD